MAVACSRGRPVSCWPLMVQTRWNSPRAAGIAIRVAHLAPPPDCPKIDAAGIAAELGDVVAHPAQREHEVEHAGVARVGVFRAGQFGEVQEAETIEPVVHRDDHDVAAPAQAHAVVEVAVDRAVVVGAAVKVHQHRAVAVVAQPRRPDIEVQAVLALHSAFGGDARRRARRRRAR